MFSFNPTYGIRDLEGTLPIFSKFMIRYEDLIKYLKEPANPPLEGNDELDDEYVGIRKNIEVSEDVLERNVNSDLLGIGE